MNNGKSAFFGSLFSAFVIWTGSAQAATKYTTMTDLKGGSDTSHSSETAWSNVFGNGGGISNGTLTVKFARDKWGTFDGLSVTVGTNGTLTANGATAGNKNGQLNIKGGAVMTLDGGTFVNNNDRTATYGNMIGSDGTDGTLRILNGGTFKSPKIHVELGAKQGSTGTLSVTDGTVEIGGSTGDKWLTVGGTRGVEATADYSGKGVLSMTNATLVAQSVVLGSAYSVAGKSDGDGKYTAEVTLKDTKVTTQRLYSLNKVKSDSFVIFDGATIETAATGKNVLDALAVDYTLAGKGVTVNTKHSGTTVGGAFAGTGPFVKTGVETLTFKGTFRESADLRVAEGTLALDSTATLPASGKISLALSGSGAFEGLDLSATYQSLTLGDDAVLPVAFADGAATTIKATETIVTATAEHPVVIKGSGVLTTETVVLSGLTVTDASLFTLDGVAGSLKIANGQLIAQKPSRTVDTLTWAKGTDASSWTGMDNWTLGDPAEPATFQAGDSAVFATAGAQAVVETDVTAAAVTFEADASVTGAATLNTANLTVAADVTATIAAPLGEDLTKAGDGKLILTDATTGKVLDLQAGQLAFAWNDAAPANPLSTEADAHTLAGVLDLGGAKQTLAGSVQKDNGLFRNGCELRHGEILVDPSDWLSLIGITDFTIGEGASVSFKKYSTNTSPTRNRGQLNLQNTYLKISGTGASFAVMNERDTQSATPYNSYGRIGSTEGGATVEVRDGGTFAHEKRCLILGFDKTQGALIGKDGTVKLGGQDLYLSYDQGSAVLALTNVTLIANAINFGWSGKTAGKQTVEFVDGTTVRVAGFKKNAVHADSSILFDGATLVATAAGNLLPDLGVPTTIGAKGLVIRNAEDVSVAAPLTGAGKLVKTGAGQLTLTGVPQLDGGLEVRAGTIGAVLTKDGFTTRNLTLTVNPDGEEKVTIDIAGTPAPGTDYTLFASGLTPETFARLEVDASYELTLDDGALKVKLMPQTLTWTGTNGDGLWSATENWNGTRAPAPFDSVVFDGEGEEMAYDLADALTLTKIGVASGAWTTKVDKVSFANTPIEVKPGAFFALADANGKTNPFSTAKDANAIAGVLDLGGATQSATGTLGGDGKGLLRDGGVLLNGKLTINPSDASANNWWRLKNTTFTVGKGATLEIAQATDQDGEIGFNGGACLVIDGGRVNALNKRSTSGTGGYIGCDTAAKNEVRILNGGTFYQPNQFLRVGYNGGATGIVSVDNGTVNLGGQELRIACDTGATGIFAMTNGTLTASGVQLAEIKSRPATFILKDSVATIGQISKGQTPARGSSVVFDGATLVDNHGATALLTDLGIPYTIAAGGLTVKVANSTESDDYVSFPGTFAGAGDFVLVAAGKTPRTAKFTGADEKGFTGTLVVSNGVTVAAGGKTFAGGLYACSGSTLDLSTSTFAGDVTIEENVSFAGLDTTAVHEVPVTLLQTKGTIDIKGAAPTTGERFFVHSRNGVNQLRYGSRPGLVIVVR